MNDSSLSRIIGIIIQTIDPDSIILFGFRATGTYRAESDYDICIVKTGIKERRKTAKLLYRALYGVGSALDILVKTPASFEINKMNPHLIYRDIARFGKIVYEKSPNC
jgi:predicted nucleotidyltransferase